MSIGHNLPIPDDLLQLFEPPKLLVENAVRTLRGFNTLLDSIFYDVPTLTRGLLEKDKAVSASGERPSRILDFDALSDPEGSLLLIDAQTPPHVRRYKDVRLYLESPDPETRDVAVATITGVGSSALGSAALAWDISIALRRPVLAIVPGYGLADVVMQGFGGWFGFGFYNFVNAKSMVQDSLTVTAPRIASIGRQLSSSAPAARTNNGAPAFRFGSGSSDVLHALLEYREPRFLLLVGHSKGALQIGNAIQSLPAERTQGLNVVTLGCPIAESVAGVRYSQYLGRFDALGQLNAWGNLPEHWLPTWHSTNPALPPAMAAGPLTEESVSPAV